MHLKTLNSPNTLKPWKAEYPFFESHCSEARTGQLAAELAKELQAGDRVLLEGPMGVGKTTFVRSLLIGLGIDQPPEGSPTFAIAHEYQGPMGEIAHIDYFRFKSEAELDDAGIPSYYWERKMIVISEWLCSWPTFREKVLNSGRSVQVQLEFQDNHPIERQIKIMQLGRHQ